MLFGALLLVFAMGLSLLLFLGNTRYRLSELLGLSFPLGIGQLGLLILLLDMCGIHHWGYVLPLLQLGLVSVWLVMFARKWKKEALWSRTVWKGWFDFKGWNVVFWVFFAAVVYLEFLNLSVTLYFPAYDIDSLRAFDTVGYILSKEQTLQGLSIFRADENPFIHDPGSCIGYSPLFQLAYAYVYWAGGETSKWIPALMFLSFLLALYGACRRTMSPSASMILIFFVMVTPRILEYSSWTITNVMHMIYASIGVIYAFLWLGSARQGDSGHGTSDNLYMWLSALFLSCNLLSRVEGVVFPLSVGVFALGYVFRKKIRFSHLLAWSLLVLLPFSFWTVFQNLSGMATETFFIMHPFLDKPKLYLVIVGFWNNIVNSTFFGYTVYVFFAAFVVSLYFAFKRKTLYLENCGIVMLALLFYALIIYHIEYVWDSLANVLNYSVMRFLFCFVPLVWYIAFQIPPVRKCFAILDDKLAFRTAETRR